ncbi:MAG: light-harvesting antenna LH1, beta subunit [Pseudomonadota bacterium]
MSTKSLSGLTEGEAQEFHNFYIQGFMIFVAVAVVAHFLVWLWRPWFAGPEGFASLEGVTQTAASVLPMLV